MFSFNSAFNIITFIGVPIVLSGCLQTVQSALQPAPSPQPTATLNAPTQTLSARVVGPKTPPILSPVNATASSTVQNDAVRANGGVKPIGNKAPSKLGETISAVETDSAPITYTQILKAIRAGGANAAKTYSLLVGKTTKVKLFAPGPQSLMVNHKDMVFFLCEKRAPGFKAGDVTSKITKYDMPEDGEISVTLANCSN